MGRWVWLAAGAALTFGAAATARAAVPDPNITVFLNAAVGQNPQDQSAQDAQNHLITGVAANTPTTFSASAALGGGTAASSATVSLGTLHALQTSDYALDGTNSDAQGSVDIFVNDFGLAQTTQLDGFLDLAGSLSPTIDDSFAGATATFVIDDLTTAQLVRMDFDSTRPQDNKFTNSLNVNVGDLIQLAYDLRIFANQGAQAESEGAFADFSHTMHVYVGEAGQGPDFISGTGHDYARTAGVPEPGGWALMLLGFAALGGLARRRKAAAPAPLTTI